MKNALYATIAELRFTDPFKQTGKPNLLASNSTLLRGSYWDGLINDVKVVPAAQAQIKVYPNPVRGEMTIDTI